MSSSSGKTGKTAIPLLYTQLPVVKAITLVNQASVQSYTELCQLLWTVYILLSCSLCVLEEVWKKNAQGTDKAVCTNLTQHTSDRDANARGALADWPLKMRNNILVGGQIRWWFINISSPSDM